MNLSRLWARPKDDLAGKKSLTYTEDEIARYWDHNADQWSESLRSGSDLYRDLFNLPAFFNILGDIHGEKILDIGCGEGYTSRQLADHGAQVIGIDLSPRMIMLAIEEEERTPRGIRYHANSSANLSNFENGFFDRVVAFMSLMDCSEYVKTVQEAFRVTKPGGEFIFNILHPCFCSPGFRWFKYKHRRVLGIMGYYRCHPFLDRLSLAGDTQNLGPHFDVLRFPRTLSDYINPLTDSGFVSVHLHEPRPSEEACRRFPRLKLWREDAALYLFVSAKKPAD